MVQAMAYLGNTYQRRCLSMMAANKENVKSNYPFAVVGVNLVLLLTEVLWFKSRHFASGYGISVRVYRAMSFMLIVLCYLFSESVFYVMFEDSSAFFELFCVAFVTLDRLWKSRGATRADFGKIMGKWPCHCHVVHLKCDNSAGDMKTLLSKLLSSNPQSIAEMHDFVTRSGLVSPRRD